MIQEIKCSGFTKHLLDSVLYFLVCSKIFLTSPALSSLHLKLSLAVFLKSFVIVALLYSLCFRETLFHGSTDCLIAKLKDWANIFPTQAIYCTF